jgi:hypothetical protein
MLVWYWAGEHLWTTQDYTGGLRYAEKALPLTYRLGDPSLQSYCERLVGLFYFRQSDYQKANRTEVKTHLNVIRFQHIPVLQSCPICVLPLMGQCEIWSNLSAHLQNHFHQILNTFLAGTQKKYQIIFGQ